MSSLVARLGIGRLVGGRRSVAIGTLGTIGLNLSSFALNFVLAVLLSRALGTAGYGAYAFAFAWSLLLSSLANLGMSALTVRYIAQYLEQEQWGRMRGLITRLNQVVGATGLVAIAVAAVVGTLFLPHDGDLYAPFMVGLLVVPLIVLTTQRQCVMQGLHRVILARAPETLVAPAVLVAVVAGFLALGVDLTAVSTQWIRLGSQAIAFVLGVWLLFVALPRAVRRAKAEYDHRSWLRVGVPLFLMGLVMAANAQVGTIVLGVFGGASEAGVFSIAARTSQFVGFLMLAATYPLMPTMARLHTLGDRALYRTTVISATRTIVLASAPIIVALLVFTEPILGLFGSDFGEGAAATRILVVGETAKLMAGVVAIALLMSGEERWMTKALGLGAALNIGLALVLAPTIGVDGAAFAQAASACTSSVLVAVYACRKQGFRLRSFLGLDRPISRPG